MSDCDDTARRLVLFDLDGTLLSTRAGARSMERAGKQVWGAAFSLAGINFAGNLDPLILAAALGSLGRTLESDAHGAFRSLFETELTRDLADPVTQVHVMPGVLTLLSELRVASDIRLGLLTGNYATTGRAKLRAAAIAPEWFELCAWGDEAPSRVELVATALARHPVSDPRQVVIVGDTPRDVECAQRNGCRVLAVATGNYTRRQLLDAGADIAVEDLRDPQVLFEMLRS